MRRDLSLERPSRSGRSDRVSWEECRPKTNAVEPGGQVPTFGTVMAEIGRVLAVVLAIAVAVNACGALFGWQ